MIYSQFFKDPGRIISLLRSMIFLPFCFLFVSSYAQAPEGMSYQAVVRDQDNKLLTNTTVGMQFSILQGSADGTAVYVETQTLTTNANGLITAKVGTGTVVSGDFSAIDWSAGPYFLKTEADPEGGDTYTISGTTQILSVPYSLFAKKAGNVFSGDYQDLSNVPVYVSAFKNDAGYLTSEKDGDPANEIQTLSIQDDTISLSKGGSVVLPPEKDGDPNNEIQVLSISGDTLFLSSGGFVKLPPDGDFSRSGHFVTTLDSVGIGTDTPHSILDVHGRITQTGMGSSVILGEDAGMSYDPAVGNVFNVLIGRSAGRSLTRGGYNIALGYEALEKDTVTNRNIAIGTKSLLNNQGYDNIAIGHLTLENNTTGKQNVIIGSAAGYSNSTGNNNTAIGYYSLWSNRTGHENTAVGSNALYANTTGLYNTAMGYNALKMNHAASFNTAVGYQSLSANSSGASNTAVGYRSLYSNTGGGMNTALGYRALAGNTTGGNNTATGYYALGLNTEGNYNTAHGNWALYFNQKGSHNTAMGSYALYKNSEGDYNTAIGDSSLFNNDADFNTAVGEGALSFNISGNKNTALGRQSLHQNQYCSENVAVGEAALYAYNDLSQNTGRNTALGRGALALLKTGKNNTAVGYWSGTFFFGSFSNSTALGALTFNSASNQVRLGNEDVTSIGGYVGWSNLSDGRFKTEVKSSVPGLSFIMKLRPVMYRLDVDKLNKFLNLPQEMQTKGVDSRAGQMVRTGFIAQEVEEAAREEGYDFSGIDPPKNDHDFYNLRYAEFVVPLVQAIQEQQAEIEALKEQNKLLQQQIDALKNE